MRDATRDRQYWRRVVRILFGTYFALAGEVSMKANRRAALLNFILTIRRHRARACRAAYLGDFMVTIDLFRNAENPQSVAAGEIIFSEGDIGDVMYVVVEGWVDLFVKGKLVEQLGAGGVFGEMALIDTGTRSATAVAKTVCKVVSINEKRFQFLVQQTPNFSLQLMRIIADRLRRMDSRL
jgi:CRP-like cAMP-binding protein